MELIKNNEYDILSKFSQLKLLILLENKVLKGIKQVLIVML